ncbi:MAG TPA: hypothetical protein VER33_03655 [Polyangiaceae bacterium]|nr:hypothetical protein [Polyangiaceae bacterium]
MTAVEPPARARTSVTIAPDAGTSVTHHVVLVPGFFGFGRFGELTYFNGVREVLESAFARLGLSVTITEVMTLPTASIRVRAARVVETLARIARATEGPIHIIGHSTGGLDSRLAIAPTASLPATEEFAAHDRIHSLVTVCCPHFGTPIATFFSSSMGKPLLRLVARYFIWLLRRGRLPLALALRLGYAIVRLRDPLRKRRSTFDELYEKLLNDFSDERRVELINFLDAVSRDQSLLFQLTPAGCDLLNACTADPDVAYGSVVTRARSPSFKSLLGSVWDLYSQIMHPLYAWLYFIAARGENLLIPQAADEQSQALARAWGSLPSARANDGVVHTNSQIWGEIVHVTTADHLDVVGQYGRIDALSWAADWIPSYSGFSGAEFEALWNDVAAFITRQALARPASSATRQGTERTEKDIVPDSV